VSVGLVGIGSESGSKFHASLYASRGRGALECCASPALLENAAPESFRDYTWRDADIYFKFLVCRAEVRRRRACDTVIATPTRRAGVTRRRVLVARRPELREYKAVFVIGDDEVSQFSDEITVNCAPLA